ncbi:MAG: hypothetical protein K0R47_3449 [Brevibacillus sp.]|nr:hypothetical protein [Brevibacillus sp.]
MVSVVDMTGIHPVSFFHLLEGIIQKQVRGEGIPTRCEVESVG